MIGEISKIEVLRDGGIWKVVTYYTYNGNQSSAADKIIQQKFVSYLSVLAYLRTLGEENYEK